MRFHEKIQCLIFDTLAFRKIELIFNLFFSGPSPAIAGADAVDYGAYTGGYGAFGWYSDHANFVGADAKGRR